MLSGRLPFQGDDAAEVMRGHLADPLPDIRSVRADCPLDLATVVTRMLAKRPASRWSDMDHVATALERETQATGIQARDSIVALVSAAPGRTPLPQSPASPAPISDIRTPRARRVATWRWGTRILLGACTLLLVAVIADLGPFGARRGRGPEPESSEDLSTESLSGSPSSPPQATTGGVGDTATRVPGTPGSVAISERPIGEATGQKRAGSSAANPPPSPTRRSETPQPAPPSADPAGAAADGAPLQWGWVLIGTRHEEAFLYINRTPQLPKAPALRWWQVPVGRVTLSVHAEGCTPWEETRQIAPGDSIRIGYRFPTCPP